jgi:hypothetical protein
MTISGTVGHLTPPETLKDISPAQKKSFKYTAQIGNVTDDPEIIIDEGAGGQ